MARKARRTGSVANVTCACPARHAISCAFMLTISGLRKSFGGRTLFADASLQVNRGDRIGLVGPNGAGKTTLFSLILQLEAPDAGTITLQRGTTLGYLPQENAPVADETVLELATAISPEISELQRYLKNAGSQADH